MRRPNDVIPVASDQARPDRSAIAPRSPSAFGSGGSSQRKFAMSSIPLAFKVSTTSARSSRFTSGSSCAGALEMFALRPEPQAMSRRGAAGAAGALIGRGAADLFDEQSIDAAPGIESRDPRQPAVDHHPHAIDREGRFRHVGGDDRFAFFVMARARRPVPPAAIRRKAAARQIDRSRARRGWRKCVRVISYLPGMKMSTSPSVLRASRASSSAARSQIG